MAVFKKIYISLKRYAITWCQKRFLLWEIELHYKQLSWSVQKQLSTTIHFRTFLQKIPLVESFFRSNYRLTVQSSSCILKCLHQEYFLGNLPLRLFRIKQLSTATHFRKFLQKIRLVESFFYSNYRLAIQSSDYILKWLHQDCFLGNLVKSFGAPNNTDCKYLR